MHPLPLVTLIIGLFVVCALALTGLIWADWRAERRLNPPQRDHLQLSLESLIQELTA
jgi:hypothetical protein